MAAPSTDVPHGTLDLLFLKTLDALGPLRLNQGSIYPALLRLQQKGWITGEWGASESNRRAKYYSLTRAGRRQLGKAVEDWQRTAGLVARFLEVRRG